MKTIEFIALPGAGKSTIRQLLIKQLKENHHNQWLSVEEAFYLAANKNIDAHLRFILKIIPSQIALQLVKKIENRSQWQHHSQSIFLANYGKTLSFFLTSNAYQYSSISDRKKGIHALLRIGSIYQCIQQQEFADKNILFDEGLIQKSIMFMPTQVEPNHEDDSYNISGYLNSIPKADILIYLKTSIENSLQRMHSRPEGLTERLRLQDQNQILSFLSRSMNHLENTVSCLRTENDIEIITIENNSSMEIAVKSIISTLKKL